MFCIFFHSKNRVIIMELITPHYFTFSPFVSKKRVFHWCLGSTINQSGKGVGMKRTIRIIGFFAFFSLAVIALFFSIVFFNSYCSEKSCKTLSANSARRMATLEDYLKHRMIDRGIEFVDEDINATGLVGPEFTELTSTPGDEREKRSTLNPMSASACVEMFVSSGLKEGDTIAVGASGSYPGFLLAVLSAATEMKLNVRLILSLGSSMYGATRPEYNIFDIAGDAKDSGLVEYELLAVSRGYKDDMGGSVMEGILFENTQEFSLEICRKEAEKRGCLLINPLDYETSVKERLELFGDVDLFVNVGGAPVNIGNGTYSFSVPVGLVEEMDNIPEGAGRGLVYEYLDEKVPVVNLLDSKGFSEKYGVEFDLSPFPEDYSPSVDYTFLVLSISLALMSIVILVALCIIFLRIRNEE